MVCCLSLMGSTPFKEEAWLPMELGEGYGAQIKEWRTGAKDLDRMKEAGLSYVRFVIPWYAVEKGKGSFVWREFDPILSLLRKKEMKAIIVLGGGHPDYTKRLDAPEDNPDHVDYELSAPTTPEEIESFARYAARTVEHYGTDGIIWEIWNEPDLERFWKPKPDPEIYARLALAACHAIREVAPAAKVVGTGSADMPGKYGTLWPGFVGTVLKSPAFGCFDALSLHAYRDGEAPPEKVLGAHENLKSFVKAFTPKGRKIPPVLVSEWGFSLTEVSEEQQAQYLLRSFLLNSLSGVPVSIWYEWRDSRLGDDHEAHYGLLDYSGKEKASYRALKAFLPPLKGARIESRIAVGDQDVFVLLVRKKDGKAALVVWTESADKGRSLAFQGGRCGVESEYQLTETPQTLECEGAVPDVSLIRKKETP